ncbi:MAG: aminoacyl-tRNA hydrolase [Pseudomonadota bacterium]
MEDERIRLIVGLGNPGRAYRLSRHNAGFMVIDALAGDFSIPVKKRAHDVRYGLGKIETIPVILAKPQDFMNRSGSPLRRLADYFRIQREAMVIVHDDIDLAYQRLKIKEKGGDGGHNGIRSIIEAFGGGEFIRVRMGVGRSEGADVVDHVLGDFSRSEREVLDDFIQRTCQAVETIVLKGIKVGMNRFNKNLH